MPHRLLRVAAAVVLLCAGRGVWADDLDKPLFSFAGFGTAGLTHSNENQADFTESALQPSGAGYTSSWSGSVDSRLGAQLTGNFTSSLSAVVQVILQQRYDNSYLPTVEWANLKYQITPDFSVRLGRIALPTFLTADYRDVGYALPWVRPPGEVYDMVPITNSDGIDVRYRARIGDLKDTVQASFGTTSFGYPGNGGLSGVADVRAARVFTNTTEFGSTTVRLSYLQGNLSLDLAQPLFDALDQFGAQGTAITDKYSGEDKLFAYVGIGVNYDPGDWFAMAEAGHVHSSSFLGERTAAYASAGYHFDKVTPYLTLAEVNANSNTSDPGLSTAGLPLHVAAEVAGLNANLNKLVGSVPTQKSISLGVRWDLIKNTALKVQFDAIRVGSGSRGDLVNLQPGFVGGGRLNVVSVNLDFVF